MYAVAALLSLISQVAGTPYISGGDTPAGTDCSGLASWVANVASGRPAFGSRFNTGNIEPALLARGFHYGTAPNSVVIGWNGGHAAVTLPDGTPVSSGESNSGVRIGGGGAYQSQFNHHMYLPVQADTMNTDPATPPALDDAGAPVTGDVVVVDIANTATDTVIAGDPAVAADPVVTDPVVTDPVVTDPVVLPAVPVEVEAELVPA
jgi:hypothetical protein